METFVDMGVGDRSQIGIGDIFPGTLKEGKGDADIIGNPVIILRASFLQLHQDIKNSGRSKQSYFFIIAEFL